MFFITNVFFIIFLIHWQLIPFRASYDLWDLRRTANIGFRNLISLNVINSRFFKVRFHCLEHFDALLYYDI